MLQRQAHVVVAERLDVGTHREGVVLGAGDRVHGEPRAALEQVHGLQVHPVDGVDLAGDDGVGAGGRVDDGDHLDLVEVAAPRVPVVRVPLEIDAHPRLEALDPVRAGADAGLPVGLAALARQDRQVVVADDEREVGISGIEGEDHGVLAVGGDVGDRRDDRLGGGLRVLAAVVVDGCDHVLGRHLPAVVVGHALAQLEGPGRGVGRGLPALRELADQRAVTGHLGEVVAVAMGHGDGEAVLVGRRVQAVDGLAVRLAHAHHSALLGGACEPDRQGERGGTGGAGLQESATGCCVHVESSLRGTTGAANSWCGGQSARTRLRPRGPGRLRRGCAVHGGMLIQVNQRFRDRCVRSKWSVRCCST